ncbi:arsenate reductase ArsC [Chrysiogenes arsenatis]|uniref:arsenate reductase ArsC n=1 Tax=Chrysiogenes arsenatis TaxID=309797 RepID=UPI000402BE82|nr:arsenate reductase ArsC [Chrysiogenes arsenatis]
MKPEKWLFVCIHNSARSQMAEAFMNQLSGGQIVAESAGIEPGKLNPIVVKVMAEIGIDISGNGTKSVFELLNRGKQYDVVVTVCDEASAERCPAFPGLKVKRLHWGFPDPSAIKEGSESERLQKIGIIRDDIRRTIVDYLAQEAQ